MIKRGDLFLTSKVRLHCDLDLECGEFPLDLLFLTSKVRLHCDRAVGGSFTKYWSFS